VTSRSQRIFDALDGTTTVDAIAILNGGANFVDSTFRYVSAVARGGYEGCAAVLLRGERPRLVVSRLEEESARTARDADILSFATQAAFRDVLLTALGGAKRIGVNAGAVPWSKVRLVQEVLPEAEIVDVGDAIARARLVKDRDESARIRRACGIASTVASEIPAMAREGMTERELAGDIAHAMQRRGASVAFPTIVAFGAGAAEPHYAPGDVRLARGDLVLADFGAKLDDYCSDITRTYVFGTASSAQRSMYEVVKQAQRLAVEATRAGVLGRDVHRAAASCVDASEFAGRFIHGTGHSIGLDVHDGGTLNDASEIVLEAGMAFTVEPGVYVPGVGGVRIEDTVLVTATGSENLTPFTKELVEIGA
jgi:Xaa-Pro dipeptidase